MLRNDKFQKPSTPFITVLQLSAILHVITTKRLVNIVSKTLWVLCALQIRSRQN